MKRNMVPLLGIAFVVAIVSTGVFYGLFAGRLKSSSGDPPGRPVVVAARDLERGAVLEARDLQVSELKGSLGGSFSKPDQAVGGTLLASLKQNEPLLEDRVLPKDPQPGQAHGSVPAGMRAISMRATDSEGLLGLLRPGARVDVQAILDRNGSVQVRTVLQNVELLALNPQTQVMQGIAGPIFNVTVLTDAASSDLAALSDSGSHIRLALRNPLDQEIATRRAMGLSAAFSSSGAAPDDTRDSRSASSRKATSSAAREPAGETQRLQIRVQVLNASSAAIGELSAKLTRKPSGAELGVEAFPSPVEADELLSRLEAKHDVEVVSTRTLDAALGASVSYRAGAGYWRLRVEFVPQTGEGGKLKLRVAPEINVGSAEGIETNRYQADLAAQGSFLIQGILKGRDRSALEKLFPGHSWADRDLAIFVTAGSSKPDAAAVAQSRRRR